MNTASPGKIVQDSEEETLKKFVLLDYKNDGACVELGRRYRARGEFSLAESAFNKAIELNPKNDQAYLGLGWCYRYQGKSSLAESAFKKAIELNPKNDQAYLGLGWCYRARGEFSLTESAFKKAIELNPKNDQAYIRLGWCYRAQGKSSLAESAFKKAIELRSGENVVAYGMRSVLYEEIGRPDMAREYVRKANSLRLEYCNAVTAYNYRKLKRILDKRGVRLVVVQYPMRSIEPLKKIFKDDAEGVIFVDNEKVFRDAVRKEGFNAYFIDMFAGDFGHCTDKGNRLMAENIAKIILQEVFHK